MRFLKNASMICPARALATMGLLLAALASTAPAANDGMGSDAQTYAGVRVTPGDRAKLDPKPVPEGMAPWNADWKVFGPVSTQKDTGNYTPWYEGRKESFSLDACTSIPVSVNLDGIAIKPEILNSNSGLIDFQQKYMMNAGYGMVYLLREETAPTAALLRIKCHAVGWLKVWNNGALIHQDGTNDYAGKTHEWLLPLQPGKNVICMRLASATGGFMVQEAGFWTRDWKGSEDMSLGSWLLQLWRAPETLPSPPTGSQTLKSIINQAPAEWKADAFTQFIDHQGTLSLASVPWRTANAKLIAPEISSKDRLYKFSLVVRAVAEADSEWFLDVKQGVQVGFVCHRAPDNQRYEVIWQVRRDGRPIYEAERYVMKDWMPDFLPYSVPQFSIEQALAHAAAIPVYPKDDTRMQVTISLRGDELVLWVDKMQLSIRTQVEGMSGREGAPGISARGMVTEIGGLEIQPLPEELRNRLALGDNPPVRWTAQRPDLTKSAAGYPTMDGLKPVTLFLARPERGIQNHHPIIGFADGKLIAAWSNAYLYEDTAGLRTMAALSSDGRQWTEAFELFPSLGLPADHDFPHRKGLSVYPAGPMVAERDGRVYLFGSTNNSPMRYLCRRLHRDNTLGPVCWFRGEAQPGDKRSIPTVTEVDDAELKQDAVWLKAWLDHESRYSPDRGEIPEAADYGEISHDPIYFCKDGTAMRVWRNYNGTHRIYVSWRKQETDPWSLGIPTNIPDSPSGVAVGSLPDGRNFLLGNQISGKLDDPDMRPYRRYFSNWSGLDMQPEHLFRDPLTLALSSDGRTFDRVWAIRWNCPRARYWGDGAGFAYPSAVLAWNQLWVLYSVNKQDMEVVGIPLERLAE